MPRAGWTAFRSWRSQAAGGYVNGECFKSGMLCFDVTCLDGNLHRDDFALCNILGDHRTVPGTFTRPLCPEKITSWFPKQTLLAKATLLKTQGNGDMGLTGKVLEAILGNELFTLCTLAYKTSILSSPPPPLPPPQHFLGVGEGEQRTYLHQVHRGQR